eukprot:31064-Pelagococcus_subviridis.AAC.2
MMKHRADSSALDRRARDAARSARDAGARATTRGGPTASRGRVSRRARDGGGRGSVLSRVREWPRRVVVKIVAGSKHSTGFSIQYTGPPLFRDDTVETCRRAKRQFEATV